ncbi:MAG: hypothetical protein RL291_733 [Pseudomonadota bacterium]|jgi:hypothetical protein
MPCDACAAREPQAPSWATLLVAYQQGALSSAVFHDAFLDTWRYARDHGFPEPKPIADLFFTVEAFSPDPALAGGPYDASETELKDAVEQAIVRLAAHAPGDLRP